MKLDMLITKLGEFGLIERLKEKIRVDSSVVKGIGDDCAVLEFVKGKYQLITSDMIIEDVDFKHSDDPYLIGRKAIAVSISDIAACGGICRYCVISLGLPRKSPLSLVDDLFRGMAKIAKEFKINIVGGDLSGAEKLTLDVTMLGVVENKNLVLRKGAKKGDIIFVSGSLGGSILGKHLKFTPRAKEARFLVENFKVHAMIDISDGLIQDLDHILKQSKAGAIVYKQFLPLSREAKGTGDALYSGEDFELLFTVSRAEAERLMKKSCAFKPIGEIVDKKHGLKILDKHNKQIFFTHKGFSHF